LERHVGKETVSKMPDKPILNQVKVLDAVNYFDPSGEVCKFVLLFIKNKKNEKDY
jgi:hypothetical protein